MRYNIAIIEPIVSINGDKNERIAKSGCLSFFDSVIILITLKITRAQIPIINVTYTDT